MASGRCILVTGATGFIGARVAAKLATEHGARVSAVVRDLERASPLARLGIEVVRADWGDRAAVAAAVSGQDVVINTAHDFRASTRANLRGFRHLVDACATAGVERLVHTSSIVVYDEWPDGDLHEDSPWGAHGSEYKNAKSAMDRLLLERAAGGGPSAAIVQPTIVYGPGGWMWTDRIVEQLRTGTVVLPERCDGHCPAVYVDDVADALILAASVPRPGAERFIVSGAEPVTWRAFFEAYAEMVGRNAIRYVARSQEPGSRPGATARLRSLAANPMQLAGSPPVRRLVGVARRAIGERRIERIRSVLLGLSRRGGAPTYLPTDEECALYASTGRCHIDNAVARLGYAPAFDFARGMARTAEYVREVQERAAPGR